MQESWEINWEDYYEILQLHVSAEPEVVEAAYRRLTRKYHPDVNKDPAAGERMKKINLAYEVLSDPEKRKRYDAEWSRKGGVTGKSTLPKPKPVVDPEYIRFKNVEPGKTQTASFIIRNAGGPYAKMLVMNPDSWVRVVRGFSLTDSDELPAQVEIEATGENWNENYSETIKVRLDEEEIQVKVELQTKSAPVGEKAKSRVGLGAKTAYAPPPPPPVSPKHGLPAWGKWAIGLAVLGLIIVLISSLWPSGTPTENKISSFPPVAAPTASELKLQQIGKNLEKWRQENGQNSRYDSHQYVIVGEHIWAIVGQTATTGLGRIIHSMDNGKTWKILWEKQEARMQMIHFFNETEGLVVTYIDILQTSNGGKTWNTFFTVRNMPGLTIWAIDSVEMKNKQNIIVNTMGGVNSNIETTDEGETWERIVYHGRYYGSKHGVLQTSDGGKTWQNIDIQYK